MIYSNFKFFIERDANPFILFHCNGRILYLNDSAEILTGSVNPKKLFELTLNYAPKTFGHKTTLMDLNYNSFSFYGLNILYENDDEIALWLYNKPRVITQPREIFTNHTLTDINLIVEANIELFKINYNKNIKLFTDQEIPSFLIDQNSLSKLFRKIFSQFNNSSVVEISLKIVIGEFMIINNQRFTMIEFKLYSDTRITQYDGIIESMANKLYIKSIFTPNIIKLEIPILK